jgi:hypothetical protein
MRQNSRADPRKAKSKAIARAKYRERKIDKFIKWSMTQKGYLKYKDLVEIQNNYNLKVYGK